MPGNIAAKQLRAANSVMLSLLRGHGFLKANEFDWQLWRGDLEVWVFSNNCAALITWRNNTPHGTAAEILTVCGTLDRCADALPVLETFAASRGANVVMSVGHRGYKRMIEKAGYKTFPKLLMHKVLHD